MSYLCSGDEQSPEYIPIWDPHSNPSLICVIAYVMAIIDQHLFQLFITITAVLVVSYSMWSETKFAVIGIVVIDVIVLCLQYVISKCLCFNRFTQA